jgi:hypothetical protein
MKPDLNRCALRKDGPVRSWEMVGSGFAGEGRSVEGDEAKGGRGFVHITDW